MSTRKSVCRTNQSKAQLMKQVQGSTGSRRKETKKKEINARIIGANDTDRMVDVDGRMVRVRYLGKSAIKGAGSGMYAFNIKNDKGKVIPVFFDPELGNVTTNTGSAKIKSLEVDQDELKLETTTPKQHPNQRKTGKDRFVSSFKNILIIVLIAALGKQALTYQVGQSTSVSQTTKFLVPELTPLGGLSSVASTDTVDASSILNS